MHTCIDNGEWIWGSFYDICIRKYSEWYEGKFSQLANRQEKKHKTSTKRVFLKYVIVSKME